MKGIGNRNYIGRKYKDIVCVVCQRQSPSTTPSQKYCARCRYLAQLEVRRKSELKRRKNPEILRKYKAYMKEYDKKRDKNRANYLARLRRLRLKRLVITKYGGMCACCGENEIRFLCMDHRNGDGKQHRKQMGLLSIPYNWYIRNGFPNTFQVLCFNCNFAKGRNRICPHKDKMEIIYETI